MPRLVRMAFVAGTWLVACASVPMGRAGDPRIEVRPNGAMHDWWKRVEYCSGVHANFYAAHFYVVPVAPGYGIDGKPADSLGYVTAGWTVGNTVTIGTPWALRGDIWMHEFAHVKASPRWHDPKIYQRRCAGIMNCEASCLTDTIRPR